MVSAMAGLYDPQVKVFVAGVMIECLGFNIKRSLGLAHDFDFHHLSFFPDYYYVQLAYCEYG